MRILINTIKHIREQLRTNGRCLIRDIYNSFYWTSRDELMHWCRDNNFKVTKKYAYNQVHWLITDSNFDPNEKLYYPFKEIRLEMRERKIGKR